MPPVLNLKTKVKTARFAETRAFYQELFDLPVAEEWDEPGDKGVILRAGADGFLEIYEGDIDDPDAYRALSLQFRVPDVHAFADAIRGKWPTEGPKARPWGSTYLYLRDPNGVLVIVFEGGL